MSLVADLTRFGVVAKIHDERAHETASSLRHVSGNRIDVRQEAVTQPVKS